MNPFGPMRRNAREDEIFDPDDSGWEHDEDTDVEREAEEKAAMERERAVKLELGIAVPVAVSDAQSLDDDDKKVEESSPTSSSSPTEAQTQARPPLKRTYTLLTEDERDQLYEEAQSRLKDKKQKPSSGKTDKEGDAVSSNGDSSHTTKAKAKAKAKAGGKKRKKQEEEEEPAKEEEDEEEVVYPRARRTTATKKSAATQKAPAKKAVAKKAAAKKGGKGKGAKRKAEAEAEETDEPNEPDEPEEQEDEKPSARGKRKAATEKTKTATAATKKAKASRSKKKNDDDDDDDNIDNDNDNLENDESKTAFVPPKLQSYSSMTDLDRRTLINQLLKEKEQERRRDLRRQGVVSTDDTALPLDTRRRINKYGTKMAYLMDYVEEVCAADSSHRIIVFSQWHRMLQMVRTTLEENNIQAVLCRGNVMSRNKAIKAFYSQQDVRVIMLSLENAASGTNLTEASHVIMIDPVGGTRDEAHAVEMQAIGRAHRQGQTKKVVVARFVMRDTVEYELYRRNVAK